jgi:catechol-2,3-dioxygenase
VDEGQRREEREAVARLLRRHVADLVEDVTGDIDRLRLLAISDGDRGGNGVEPLRRRKRKSASASLA